MKKWVFWIIYSIVAVIISFIIGGIQAKGVELGFFALALWIPMILGIFLFIAGIINIFTSSQELYSKLSFSSIGLVLFIYYFILFISSEILNILLLIILLVGITFGIISLVRIYKNPAFIGKKLAITSLTILILILIGIVFDLLTPEYFFNLF